GDGATEEPVGTFEGTRPRRRGLDGGRRLHRRRLVRIAFRPGDRGRRLRMEHHRLLFPLAATVAAGPAAPTAGAALALALRRDLRRRSGRGRRGRVARRREDLELAVLEFPEAEEAAAARLDDEPVELGEPELLLVEVRVELDH